MGFLDGIRVVDASRLLPGGYCSMLLSDLGATVIKVEQPGLGDYMRATPPTEDGTSPVHSTVNRNKLSIGIDLGREEGKQVLGRLIRKADVFIEGFRPGAMGRLGFSYEMVRRMTPKIIYCSISTFGQQSKLSYMPGHDINFQAMAGTLGYPSNPSVPPIQLGDISSGMFAAVAILAALARKKRGPVFIDVPIVPSLLSWMILPVSAYLATGESPSEGHSLLFGSDSYYNLLPTSDHKHVAIAAIEEEFWRNLVVSMGVPELQDKRFGDVSERKEASDVLRRIFLTKTRDEWSRLLMPTDTCATPVLTVQEALKSDWVKSSGMLTRVPGDGTVLNNPVKSSPPMRSSKFTSAPSLGQHTIRIMDMLGYSRKRTNQMRRTKAIQ
jgi:alpha-methylacyl-CoA racemase